MVLDPCPHCGTMLGLDSRERLPVGTTIVCVPCGRVLTRDAEGLHLSTDDDLKAMTPGQRSQLLVSMFSAATGQAAILKQGFEALLSAAGGHMICDVENCNVCAAKVMAARLDGGPPKFACPVCKKVPRRLLDGLAMGQPAIPQPGDLVLCSCLSLLVVGSYCRLHEAVDADIKDDRLRAAAEDVRSLVAKRRAKGAN